MDDGSCWSTTRPSFVHTLGNYFRQTGAEVTTLRREAAPRAWRR